MNNAEFTKGIRVYKLKSTPETEVLRESIIKADKAYNKVFDVSEFYKQYLIEQGYTNVICRMIKNPIMKSMQIFGFSADQDINDVNFNGAKTKLNTTYFPLKRTQFNKDKTNDMNDLHTSYGDVCDLMTGRLSAKQYEPSVFKSELGSTFMLYFNYQIRSNGDILFIIHEQDLYENTPEVALSNNVAKHGEVYDFVMKNYDLEVSKETEST